jgi:hypothetical protein
MRRRITGIGHVEFLTSLIAILTVFNCAKAENTNILTNPGFESNSIGWTARNCSITTVSSPVYSGLLSGRAYSRTATWQGIQQDMLGKISTMANPL